MCASAYLHYYPRQSSWATCDIFQSHRLSFSLVKGNKRSLEFPIYDTNISMIHRKAYAWHAALYQYWGSHNAEGTRHIQKA